MGKEFPNIEEVYLGAIRSEKGVMPWAMVGGGSIGIGPETN